MARAISLTFAGAAVALFATQAIAQTAATYPDRPVQMIVPFPAGGPADILGRAVAQKLSEAWGQGVVIENKPGANTAIAAARVAKSTPDGYTLFVVMDVTMVLNPLTNKVLPYDPVKDFAPISLLSKNTSLLTVRADDGPKSIQELIARGKANPGKLNYGAGIITTQLAASLFNREVGITAQFVPFQGSPPTVLGLMTGSVDYIVDGAAASLPMIQAGKLRALAKTNNGPVPPLPNLKSLAEEAGKPALEDVSTWIGLVAPAGTPRDIVEKINRDIAKAYANAEFIEMLRNAGLNPVGSKLGELEKFIGTEAVRWAVVVKDAGIEPN
jgi:tripartite-type tricarboxylate transporter receptor subunit TctC